MALKLHEITTPTDWIKLAILIGFAAASWSFVWNEYQKPLVDVEARVRVTHPDRIRSAN